MVSNRKTLEHWKVGGRDTRGEDDVRDGQPSFPLAAFEIKTFAPDSPG